VKEEEPATDPTVNVIALVEAGLKRQDDLRELEATHIREISALRDAHVAELRAAESARIDAIRAVDQANVTRAAEVASIQATTLAAQVSNSAETLRGQVEASKNAAALALTAALTPIQTDIADLRKTQFTQQGERAQQVDTRNTSQWTASTVISLLVATASIFTLVLLVASGHFK
jgi:hypothetical protein